MKLYFTYGLDEREGFERMLPFHAGHLADESVEEIQGQGLLEILPLETYLSFFEECWRLLKPEGKATFSVPHYGSSRAWAHPLAQRAFSEMSLHFLSKEWCRLNKVSNLEVRANFDVAGSFAIEETYMNRSEQAREFGMRHYNNIAQAILFTLTKRPLE